MTPRPASQTASMHPARQAETRGLGARPPGKSEEARSALPADTDLHLRAPTGPGYQACTWVVVDSPQTRFGSRSRRNVPAVADRAWVPDGGARILLRPQAPSRPNRSPETCLRGAGSATSFYADDGLIARSSRQNSFSVRRSPVPWHTPGWLQLTLRAPLPGGPVRPSLSCGGGDHRAPDRWRHRRRHRGRRRPERRAGRAGAARGESGGGSRGSASRSR